MGRAKEVLGLSFFSQLGMPGQCGQWAWPFGRRSVCSATTRGEWRNNKEREEKERGVVWKKEKSLLHPIYNSWDFFGTTIEHFKPNPVGVQHLFAFVKFVYCESRAKTVTAPEREPFLS